MTPTFHITQEAAHALYQVSLALEASLPELLYCATQPGDPNRDQLITGLSAALRLAEGRP
jgi:hypothetical protein